MKENISKLHDCYGCGVCTAACPVNIIQLRENKLGFYEPVIISEDKCIECGLCLKVCAFNNRGLALKNNTPECMAGWSENAIIRQRCSSGGIGFEIGKQLIEKGYKACGVRYDIGKERAEHFISATVDDFTPTIGSKYIQSFTEDAFRAIEKNCRYFVTGTPCQIDSFRRYLQLTKREDNFILMDFFCHGVPSMLLWRKYLHEVEKKVGKAKFVAWRNKTCGWQDSWNINIDPEQVGNVDWHNSYNINILEKKHFYQSRWKGGDLFYRFFLGNYCLNKCCYKSCKYKELASSADIRIGDLWGRKFKNDNKGTSAVIALTKRGKDVINCLKDCTFEGVDAGTATEGQMPHSPSLPLIYNKVMEELGSDKSLEDINGSTIKQYRFFTIPKRAVNKLCYMLNLKPILH